MKDIDRFPRRCRSFSRVRLRAEVQALINTNEGRFRADVPVVVAITLHIKRSVVHFHEQLGKKSTDPSPARGVRNGVVGDTTILCSTIDGVEIVLNGGLSFAT